MSIVNDLGNWIDLLQNWQRAKLIAASAQEHLDLVMFSYIQRKGPCPKSEDLSNVLSLWEIANQKRHEINMYIIFCSNEDNINFEDYKKINELSFEIV